MGTTKSREDQKHESEIQPMKLHRLAAQVLRRFGMRVTTERCDDAVQEWWLLALERGHGESPYPAMLAACGRLAERGRRRRVGLEEAPEPATPAEQIDEPTGDAICGAVAELGRRERELIEARFYRGDSLRQIAARSGLSVATVRRVLLRALRLLRSKLVA